MSHRQQSAQSSRSVPSIRRQIPSLSTQIQLLRLARTTLVVTPIKSASSTRNGVSPLQSTTVAATFSSNVTLSKTTPHPTTAPPYTGSGSKDCCCDDYHALGTICHRNGTVAAYTLRGNPTLRIGLRQQLFSKALSLLRIRGTRSLLSV